MYYRLSVYKFSYCLCINILNQSLQMSVIKIDIFFKFYIKIYINIHKIYLFHKKTVIASPLLEKEQFVTFLVTSSQIRLK